MNDQYHKCCVRIESAIGTHIKRKFQMVNIIDLPMLVNDYKKQSYHEVIFKEIN